MDLQVGNPQYRIWCLVFANVGREHYTQRISRSRILPDGTLQEMEISATKLVIYCDACGG